MRFILPVLAAVAVFQGCGDDNTGKTDSNNVQKETVYKTEYRREYDNDFTKFLADLKSAHKVSLKHVNAASFATNRDTYTCAESQLKNGQAFAQKLFDGESLEQFTNNADIQACIKRKNTVDVNIQTQQDVNKAKELEESKKKNKELEEKNKELEGKQKTAEEVKILDKHAEAEKQQKEYERLVNTPYSVGYYNKLVRLDAKMWGLKPEELAALQRAICLKHKTDILFTADREAACIELIKTHHFVQNDDGTTSMRINGNACDTLYTIYPFANYRERKIRKYECEDSILEQALKEANKTFDDKVIQLNNARDKVAKQEAHIAATFLPGTAVTKAQQDLLDKLRANVVTLEGSVTFWTERLSNLQTKKADNDAKLEAARIA